MGAIASLIYGVMFDRAFLGATYCAVVPLFRKAVHQSNRQTTRGPALED
jgi:hypothetical protein